MCANCETYGADHEMPTEPGLSVTPRIRRQFDRSFDAVVFDLPIVPVTYVGVRKSELNAYRRETTQMIKFGVFIFLFGAGLLALVELSYHGWL